MFQQNYAIQEKPYVYSITSTCGTEKQKYKIMQPKRDLVFKMLFGIADQKNQLKSLLGSILDLSDDELSDMTIADPHLGIEFIGNKMGILDIKVFSKYGSIIDIEIQLFPSSDFLKRLLFYTAKMSGEQMRSADHYGEIKKVIAIAILDYPLLEEDNYHNKALLTIQESGRVLTDLLEYHFLELGKLPEEWDGTQLYYWMQFLRAEKEEEFEMLAEKDKDVKKSVIRLMELSQDERMRMLCESQEKAKWDYESRMRDARENGLAEGEKKGRVNGLADGKAEVALNLLKIGMDREDILEVTGFSEEALAALEKNHSES